MAPTTFDSITVLELRQALAGGAPDMTIAEALVGIRRAEADYLEREALIGRHATFLKNRVARRAEAINEAVNDALVALDRDVARRGDITGWRKAPRTAASPSSRHAAAQDAAREAGEAYDARYPELDASAWADAGEPDIFENPTGPIQRATSRIKAVIA